MRKLAGAAMLIVTVVTVFMVKGFLDQANMAAQARQNAQLIHDMAAQSGESGSGAGLGTDVPDLTEADYAAALDFAARYYGEWNVQKFYNGEEWKIYELGKRMAIVAYNFLNDIEFTTGGYEQFTGYDPIKKVTYIDNKTGLLEEVKVTGYAAAEALEKKGDVLDTQLVGMRSKYEYVPEKRHKLLHGKDIEYSTPAITISDQGVDMSEMGGPIFHLEGFRVDTIDGQDYLVNVYYDFAITYDGDYLEYCEPTISGKYQGYYAFY